MVDEIVRTTLSVLYIVASTPYISVLTPILAPTRDVSLVMSQYQTPIRIVSKLTPIPHSGFKPKEPPNWSNFERNFQTPLTMQAM